MSPTPTKEQGAVMETESAATDLLTRRLKKSIASVLGVKEREIDRYLPTDARDKLRKVVLDQFNGYHELCLDVIRSIDTGNVSLNSIYFDKLEEIRQAIRDLTDDPDG